MKLSRIFVSVLIFFVLIFFVLWILIPSVSQNSYNGIPAQKSIAVFVLDGTPASKITKSITPNLEKLSEKSLTAESFHPVIPSTTESHSIMYIAGDCGNAGKAQNCVDNAGMTSLCDYARLHGMLCVMASEAGDFKQARSEFDIAFYDSGFFDFRIEVNSFNEDTSLLKDFFEGWENKTGEYRSESGIQKYAFYSKYIIDVDNALIKFFEEELNGRKFLLFSNIKGNDFCGHDFNETAFTQCISILDKDSGQLIQTVLDSNGLVAAFTADHGMAFECPECKGHHAEPPYSLSPEVMDIPLIIYDGKDFGAIETSANTFDLMPSMFYYAGLPDSCSSRMRYCKGKILTPSFN
ncbi:MAG: hypothetical protein AB1467_02365 [Candidatus Diapherotrites archaeon]